MREQEIGAIAKEIRGTLNSFLDGLPDCKDCPDVADGEHQGRTDVFDEVVERLRAEAKHRTYIGDIVAHKIYTEAADMLERDITREPQGG